MDKKIFILIFLLIELGTLLPMFISGSLPSYLDNQIVIMFFVFGNLLALFGLLA